MAVTALKPEDLPFRQAGIMECEAARAADALMELPGIPGQFRVQFIGTGVASLPESTPEIFAGGDAQSPIEMEWYQNKFVGHHWLLGDFKAELAPDRVSRGTVTRVEGESVIGGSAVNTNDFFLDFQFRRFPALTMRNITPIRNSALVSAIPPTGSVFRLEQPENGQFEFRAGINRISDPANASRRVVKFNQCDVVVFPERNVGLGLLNQSRIGDNEYSVTVEIENTTTTEATFAYFSVIHYTGIEVSDDYGFVRLKPGAKKAIAYKVLSRVPGRTVDLPFFGALYKPERLNGSKSLDLRFAF